MVNSPILMRLHFSRFARRLSVRFNLIFAKWPILIRTLEYSFALFGMHLFWFTNVGNFMVDFEQFFAFCIEDDDCSSNGWLAFWSEVSSLSLSLSLCSWVIELIFHLHFCDLFQMDPLTEFDRSNVFQVDLFWFIFWTGRISFSCTLFGYHTKINRRLKIGLDWSFKIFLLVFL